MFDFNEMREISAKRMEIKTETKRKYLLTKRKYN